MNPLEPTHSVRVQLAKCRFEEEGGGVPSEPRVRGVVCRGVGCVTVMPEDGLLLVRAVQSPFEQPQVAHLPFQRCVLTRFRVFRAWGRWIRRAELFPRGSRHCPRLVFSPPRPPFEQPQVAHLPFQRCVLTRFRVFRAWGRWIRRAELFPRGSRHCPRLVFSPPRRVPRREVDAAG